MMKTKWSCGPRGARHVPMIAFAAVVVGVIGVFGLSARGNVPLGLAGVAFVQPESTPAWVQRIAVVDEALGRSDLSRAIYEWREALGAAQRSGRSEGLIAVGDCAVRIAELSGRSAYFRREAGELYVYAAFRARAERSRDTILGIAEVLERLGDGERAAHVRRIAASMS